MLRKFGSMEAFQQVILSQNLPGRALSAGLQITQEKLSARVQSCTVNSHRLVAFVTSTYGPAVTEILYNELNVGHFTDSKVLNDSSFLLSCCERVPGIDVRLCRDFLSSKKGTSAVLGVVSSLHEMGVHSIPTLLVANGEFVISGAASASDVATTLRLAARNAIERRRRRGGSAAADALPRLVRRMLDCIDED